MMNSNKKSVSEVLSKKSTEWFIEKENMSYEEFIQIYGQNESITKEDYENGKLTQLSLRILPNTHVFELLDNIHKLKRDICKKILLQEAEDRRKKIIELEELFNENKLEDFLKSIGKHNFHFYKEQFNIYFEPSKYFEIFEKVKKYYHELDDMVAKSNGFVNAEHKKLMDIYISYMNDNNIEMAEVIRATMIAENYPVEYEQKKL